ncbi:hypothetical protein BDN70DRAFT_920047 [Pholiota conissans]|uniref:Uncharacterized protein n=1 Tax=Pholiota conissans TaxID=109636 RepID=A0A9P6CUY9_9AGAR|nr:hypothetical protein BDN70DRAFT_920047 [Pholiota conissans]
MTSSAHKQPQKQQAKQKQKKQRSQRQSKAQEQHQIGAEKARLCASQKTFAGNSLPLETTRPMCPIAIGSIAEVKEDIHAGYADSEQRRDADYFKQDTRVTSGDGANKTECVVEEERGRKRRSRKIDQCLAAQILYERIRTSNDSER